MTDESTALTVLDPAAAAASVAVPTELPPNPLPRPPYASLDAAFARPETSEWSNPQSEVLWERALDKMSRVMTAVMEDTLRSDAPPHYPIHLPPRPFQPTQSPIVWEHRFPATGRRLPGVDYTTRRRADFNVKLQSTEVFWYAVPSDMNGGV